MLYIPLKIFNMSSSCIKLTDFDKYYYAAVEKVFADDWEARRACMHPTYKDPMLDCTDH